MTLRRIPRACWSAVVVSSLAAPLVRADELDAKDLFAQGRELRLQGDCASALPLFRRAYEAYPAGLGSLRNMAECEETLGHFGSARRAWTDLQQQLIANNEGKYEGWQQDAVQAAARLAAKLGTLTIEVHAVTAHGIPARATGIDVSLNGERLSPTVVGIPLDQDPGHYVVSASGPGPSVAEERVVDLAAGEAKRVDLRVVVPSLPEENGVPSRVATQRTAAWIAASLGAASLVGAGIAAFERQSALNDLTTQCGSTATCLPAHDNPSESLKVRGIEDRGHEAATWVNVLTVAGAVGLSCGVVLYAAGQSRSSHTALLLSPAGISAVGTY